MITEQQFKEATGQEPVNDDLDRCNCRDAGKMMHQQCGWSTKHNLPMFLVPYAEREQE